jgi:hypothetical protein
MSFVAEMAKAFGKLGPYPDLAGWIGRPPARRSSAGLPGAGITVSRNSGDGRLPISVSCLNIAPEPQNLGQSGQMWYLARAASDRHS